MYSRRLLSALTLLLSAALLTMGCDENAPTVTDIQVDYNCGRPEVTARVDRDDETITNIMVNWGRNNLATNPPQLYASDTLGLPFGDPADWDIRTTGGQNVTLPTAQDLDLFLRFAFAVPIAVNEKLVLNLQVQYTRPGESTQSTFSERITIPFEPPAPECNPQQGGGNPGGGTPGGGVIDNSPPSCPVDSLPTGGLLAPVIDPAFVDGPVDGEACAGSVAGNATVVPFMWRPVDGAASTNKAYQVEVVRDGQASCLADWTPGGSAHWSGDAETCQILDTNTEGTALSLLQNTRYRWRVRASCIREDDTIASGPFSPDMTFETAGAPEKLSTRLPASGATIPTPISGTSATSVTFEWLPVDCGPATYHLRIVEAFEAPEDDDDLFDYPNATSVDGPGQMVTVNQEERIRMTAQSLEAGRSFVWWVYADTPSGRTPVLTTQDLQTFSVED